MMLGLQIAAILLLSPAITLGQLPSICNTPDDLATKTCCPNDCSRNGRCESITALVSAQEECADQKVIDILRNTPNVPEKGTADARYRWPTVVFENVCVCDGNFWGADCSECDFGWTGDDCNERKTLVVRKSFARLSKEEKETFIDATQQLKTEMGRWSVVAEEPLNYSTGTVTLQNVSTYDFFIYLHDYVARDGNCGEVNMDVTIDFAHEGPVFPVWHRRYLLTLEREFQRITKNVSFAFPYWQWEENDKSPFAEEYYGIPSNVYGPPVNVSGVILNPEDWNTICDITYWNPNVNCQDSWKACNPANDLAERRQLQRGGGSAYLPDVVEVMIAIAAPLYDAPDKDGQYSMLDPRQSFRSRLEGWNEICSAARCVGTYNSNSGTHVHNIVHVWVGGQMDDVPAAVNDPVFNLHHCNVDRVLESWMQSFTKSSEQLPPYVPICRAHPGHNRDDYIVPFFPLVIAEEQYRVAEEWGYVYDELIPANIPDTEIPTCSKVIEDDTCPICDANATCIDCTNEQCPAPSPETERLSIPEDDETELPLGLGLGIPLLIAIIIIIILIIIVIVCVFQKKSKSDGSGGSYEMTTKT